MLARNLLTTTASIIVRMMLSFAASVMLARLLGAELRGIYALAVLISETVYAFGTLGLSTSNIVFAGKYPEKRGAIAFHSLAFSLLISLLTLGFCVYVLKSQPAWFSRFRVIGTINLILACCLVFPRLASIYLESGVLGANRIFAVNLATVLMPLSQIVLLLVLLGVLGLGVTGGIITQLGSFGFMLLFMFVATAMQVPIRTWRPDLPFFKKSMSLGLKTHLNHMAWYVAHRIDMYMIAFLIPNSDTALGQYAVAAQFAQVLWLLPQSLQTVFLPYLSVTSVAKERITVKTSRVLFIMMLPICGLLLIGAPLIKIILGTDYAESILPFIVFLPGIFLFGSVQPLDSYLTHSEKPMYGAVNSWIGALTNIGLNSYFIPRSGIAGAALASSLSVILMALITVGCFKYETKLRFSQFMLCRSDFASLTGIAKGLIGQLKSRIFSKLS